MGLQLDPPSKCQADVLVITHLTLDSTPNLDNSRQPTALKISKFGTKN
jgi:hypothetical protein